ncbi:S53 family peptidase [Streptacidiphilus melanogenes]|uniref:S53 family peptidase n=1 Tax=Streptacidiphilus melanogenes TaxID=411235 RepID=UPI000AEDFA4E|nr:protease pro-enzyme activation domain-containing protein [Streptacidiphilus melanogenes]
MRLRPDLRLNVGVLGALAALAASLAAVPAAHAHTVPQSRVLGDDVVPDTGRAQHLGELPRSAYLRLAFTLTARNKPALDRYVSELDDPGSPHYRHYLRGKEFTAAYGRTADEIDRLRAFLAGNGFHIDDVHSGRLVVDASATAADVERTFRIRLDTWRDPSTGRAFYGNTTPPTLPADPGLLVADIAGLTDKAVRASNVHFGGVGGLAPRELRAAYRAGPTGQGEQRGTPPRVALVEFAGFQPQDIAVYDRRFAPTSPAPELRLVDGGPDDQESGREAVEAELETVQAVAPTAVTQVFSAENSAAGEIDACQGVIDAGVTVAMTGWGAPEDERTASGLRAIDLILEEGAAEGIGFYASSPDPVRRPRDRADLGAQFPASDPYATAVGAADDAGRVRGDGRSMAFAKPWWQARWDATADPRARREVPDVMARLAPGVRVQTGGRWRTATGAGIATALATALAAGQHLRASACGGESAPGFAAPTLYRLWHEQASRGGAVPDKDARPFDVARMPDTVLCPNRQLR